MALETGCMALEAGCMALGASWAPMSTLLEAAWALESTSMAVGWAPASMALGTEWTPASEVLFSVLALVSVTLGVEAPPRAPLVAIEVETVPVGIGVGVETVGPSPALGRVKPLGARGPQVVLYSVTVAVASKTSSPFRG